MVAAYSGGDGDDARGQRTGAGGAGGSDRLRATNPYHKRRRRPRGRQATPSYAYSAHSPPRGVTGITAFRGQNPTRTHGEQSPPLTRSPLLSSPGFPTALSFAGRKERKKEGRKKGQKGASCTSSRCRRRRRHRPRPRRRRYRRCPAVRAISSYRAISRQLLRYSNFQGQLIADARSTKRTLPPPSPSWGSAHPSNWIDEIIRFESRPNSRSAIICHDSCIIRDSRILELVSWICSNYSRVTFKEQYRKDF